MAAALKIEALCMAFGGVKALDGLSMALAAGERIGLIGANGSGKTTLLNLLSGHHAPDSGSIRLGHNEIAGLGSVKIARLGLARTFQNLRLLGRLSVYENVRVARHGRMPFRQFLWQSPSTRRSERDTIMSLLETFNLAQYADNLPSALGLMAARKLELARMVAASPQIVLLDEPAAGVSSEETEELIALIRTHVLPQRTAIMIEHKMELIEALCTRIIMLEAGKKIADGPLREVLQSSAYINGSLVGASC